MNKYIIRKLDLSYISKCCDSILLPRLRVGGEWNLQRQGQAICGSCIIVSCNRTQESKLLGLPPYCSPPLLPTHCTVQYQSVLCGGKQSNPCHTPRCSAAVCHPGHCHRFVDELIRYHIMSLTNSVDTKRRVQTLFLRQVRLCARVCLFWKSTKRRGHWTVVMRLEQKRSLPSEPKLHVHTRPCGFT